MSWTTTFSTSQIVTATELNTLLPTNSQTSSAKIIDTIYQNTTGTLRFVNISCYYPTGGGTLCKCGSTTPPATIVSAQGAGTNNQYVPAFFMVKPNFYYTCSTAGSAVLSYWTEWDLF